MADLKTSQETLGTTPVDTDYFAGVQASDTSNKRWTFALVKAWIQAFLGISGAGTPNVKLTKAMDSTTVHLDTSSVSFTLPASSNVILCGNIAGIVTIRDGVFSGEMAQFWITPGGGAAIIFQTGTKYSVTATPTANNFGISYDSGGTVWRLYSGRAADVTFTGRVDKIA